jgi:hypothetical protein
MSHDARLSEQRMGTDLPSISRDSEMKLASIMLEIKDQLSKDYGIKLEYESRLYNTELYQFLKGRPTHVIQCKCPERTCVIPDGGIILIRVGKKRMPLLISEHKKQGDGKHQAMGNAIERSNKNVMWFQPWMIAESIMPYLIVCCGRDFRPQSYIIDRLAAITHYYPLNLINVYKDDDGLGGVSVLYTDNYTFSHDDVYNFGYAIAKKALSYYDGKYKILKRPVEDNEQPKLENGISDGSSDNLHREQAETAPIYRQCG